MVGDVEPPESDNVNINGETLPLNPPPHPSDPTGNDKISGIHATPTLELENHVSEADMKTLWGGTLVGSESPNQSIKPVPDYDSKTITLKPGAVALPRLPGSSGKLTVLSIATRRDAASGNRAPHIEIIDKIGEGGMGAIYRAWQNSLDREIALKRIKGDAAKNEQVVRLFMSEAHVTGLLEHPNIVPIHELGVDSDGNVFYTMKLIKGTPWKDLLYPKPGNGVKDVRDHLDILLKVCDALSLAHSMGIVHRDLKPDNVMVGEFGEVLVLDWGLAVTYDESASTASPSRMVNASHFQGPCGTPQYMAPEMARCDTGNIGPASDVYLLGALLYEILFRRAPHTGDTIWTVLMSAAQNQLSFPDDVPATIAPYRHVLEKTLAKAMATDPADRYRTAAEFADSLRSNLRNFDSIATANAAVDQLWTLRDIDPDAIDADTIRHVYSQYADVVSSFNQSLKSWPENADAKRWLYDARLDYADFALKNGDLALAEAQLDAAQTSDATVDSPSDAGRVLSVLRARLTAMKQDQKSRRRMLRFLKVAAAALLGIVFSGGTIAFFWIRAERDIAETSRDRAVESEQQERTQRRKAVAALAKAEWESYVNKVRLAQAAFDNADISAMKRSLSECPQRFRNWEWGHMKMLTHLETRILRGHTKPIWDVAYSPDGSRIATAGWDNTIRLWDADSGRQLMVLTGFADAVRTLAFSPDGTRIAGAGNDRTIRIYAARTGKPEQVFTGHRDPIADVVFSPDGKELASASWDGAIRIWQITGDSPASIISVTSASASGDPVPRAPLSLAYSRDGAWLAAGDETGDVHLYNAKTHQEKMILSGHTAAVLAVLFTSKGVLISTGSDRTVRIWDVNAGECVMTLYGHTRNILSMALSPDEKTLATASYDNTAMLWDMTTGKPLQTIKGHAWAPTCVAFSPDGTHIVTGSYDTTAKIWTLDRTQGFLTLPGHAGAVRTAVYSPDEKRILTVGKDGKAILFDAASLKKIKTIPINAEAPFAAFSPDGKWIVLIPNEAAIPSLFHADDGSVFRTLAGAVSRIRAIAFSRGSRILATASSDGKIRIYDIPGARLLQTIPAHKGDALCVAVSPDGRRVASGGRDKTARVFDIATGNAVLTCRDHAAIVRSVAFSPDGKYLATAGDDRIARIWNLGSGGKPLVLKEGHSDWIRSLAFSPDGSRLVTGSDDTTTRVWDTNTGLELLVLRGDFGQVLDVSFSPDGMAIIQANSDGTARIWPANAWTLNARTVRNATRGDIDAMLALAHDYRDNVEHDFEVKDSITQAMNWYRRAVTAGSLTARSELLEFEKQHRMAILQMEEENITERSGAGAMLALAHEYLQNIADGIQPLESGARALLWLNKAAAAGSDEAKKKIAAFKRDHPVVYLRETGESTGATFQLPPGYIWKVHNGRWMQTDGGGIAGYAGNRRAYLYAAAPHDNTFRLTVTVKLVEGDTINIWFAGSKRKTIQNAYMLSLKTTGATLYRNMTPVANNAAMAIARDRNVTVTIERNAGAMTCSIDNPGVPSITYSDPDPIIGAPNNVYGFALKSGMIVIQGVRITPIR